jgi:hypothetical protein
MSPTASSAVASGWSRARRRGRWLPVLLVVAGLHLLLLLLAQRALRSPPPRPVPTQAALVLVWVQPPAPPPPAPPAREPPAAKPARRPPQPSVSAEPAAVQAAAPASAADVASAAPPATQAAASAPTGGLLDTEASRRAIREAARQHSTGEMGAQATGEKAPVSDQDRMGQEIARGARGDCLKGEYAGSGMGLLSLPFWLIAELREKCRR